MLNPLARARLAGVSLIEMMIAIVIMALAVAIAMPIYSVWIQNSHIRNASESIQNGMQRARAEAVARNTSVAFVLGGGPFWTISVVGTGEVIESRPAGEISQNVLMSVFPAPPNPMVDPPTTTVSFGSLGTVIANSPVSASITQIDFDSTTLPAADSRDLRITIGAGGSVRMCDPNVSVTSDPRHC